MTLSYREYEDPAVFAVAVKPFLMEREAEHCLLLGISATLTRPGSPYTGRNHLALVEDDGVVCGALLMTPPFGPLISRVGDPLVVRALADGLLGRKDDVPTVFGPAQASDAFAARWTEITRRTAAITLRERVYQLTSVRRPVSRSGTFRAATEADRDLLIEWLFGFNKEAFGADSAEADRAEMAIDSRLRDPGSGFLIWEDGEPVALAGYCDPTPNGVRIGPVYTPDRFRGRGYASALTAELSQQLLDRGKEFTFLFTDLANPISNHVYEKIGYEPVTDFRLWSFEKSG